MSMSCLLAEAETSSWDIAFSFLPTAGNGMVGVFGWVKGIHRGAGRP